MTLEELQTDYAKASSQRHRALICRQAWDMLPVEVRRSASRGDWLAARFPSTSTQDHELYCRLCGFGSIDALWDRIEGAERMVMTTALKLARRAKASHRSLVEVLVEYDALPILVQCKDGTTFRKQRMERKHAVAKCMANTGAPIADPRAGWAAFRAFNNTFIDSLLAGTVLSDDDRHSLMQRFDVVIAQAQAELQREVWRLREHSKMVQGSREAVSRSEIIQACRNLAMDPPRLGKPVDMELAKKQKRRLARAYHPDTNNGVVDLGGYQATLAAYETLEEYNKALEAS